MKKIAIITGYYPPGGVVTYVKNLYSILGKYKELDLTLFLNSPDKEYDKKIHEDFPGIKTKVTRVPPFRFIRGGLLMLKLLMNFSHKPFNFIEIHHTSYANILSFLVPSKKLIIMTHGPDVLDSRMNNPLYRFLAKRAYKKAKLIISHTHEEIEKIKSLGISEKKLRFIPCGVDIKGIEKFQKTNLRKELGIKNKYVVCTTYGMNYWRKGTHFFLESIPELMKEDLAVIMTGYMTNEFAKRVEDLQTKFKGRFFWIGFRKDVPNVLKNSDIYVIPTLIEGMSVSLLEAMAAGKACIATTGVGENDLSLKDSGILINPKSSEEIIKGVRKLVENPKMIENYSKKAKQRVKKFSWEKVAELEKQIILDLR